MTELWPLLRFAIGGIAAALLALAAVAAALALHFRRSLPQVDGRVRLAGLHEPVEIIRDVDGVPHIYAGSLVDAYAALGYVHAQDRLWQMELQRRTGAGRMAEVFGRQLIPFDRFMRTVGLHRAAERAWAACPDDARACVDAYVRGINGYVQDCRGARRPPEFQLLRLAPRPWVPVDVMTCGKAMAWQLAGTYVGDLLRADLIEAVGPALTEALMAASGRHPAAPPSVLDDTRLAAAARPDARSSPVADALAMDAAVTEGIGTSQWVVDGTRTASRRPMLATDPHLAPSLPAAWYVAHLATSDHDVIGATIPGLPVVMLGRNRTLAWGVASGDIDVQDLFRERIDGEEGELAPAGHTTPVISRVETVTVRGGSDVAVTVRTTPHGPLISDAMNANRPAAPPRPPLALRWTALDDDDRTLAGFLTLNRARDGDELERALHHHTAPVLNVVYADVRGTIGSRLAGRVPRRTGQDGALPARGWMAEDDWQGWIPFDEMPAVRNPSGHIIASGNTRVLPDGYPHFLGREQIEPYRTERLRELIARDERLSAAAFASMQTDTISSHARTVMPLLLSCLAPDDPQERRVLAALKAWDADIAAPGAAPIVFETWWRHLLRRLVGIDLPPELVKQYEVWPSFVARYVRQRLTDPDRATRDAVHQAFTAAVEELRAARGRDERRWSNRRSRTVAFAHRPLHRRRWLRPLVSRSMPAGGDWSSINVGGVTTSARVVRQYVASYRQVIDLASPDGGGFALALGQSGHPLSPHYADLARPWREGRLRPMRLSRAAVERGRRATLHLDPS